MTRIQPFGPDETFDPRALDKQLQVEDAAEDPPRSELDLRRAEVDAQSDEAVARMRELMNLKAIRDVMNRPKSENDIQDLQPIDWDEPTLPGEKRATQDMPKAA